MHSMAVVVPYTDCCQFYPGGESDGYYYSFSLGEFRLDVLIRSEELLLE